MSRYRSSIRRPASRSSHGPRLLFAIIVVIGVIIAARWFFSRGQASTSTNTSSEISLVNDPVNVDTQMSLTEEANLNTGLANSNAGANTNATTNTSTSSSRTALTCTGAISQISTTSKTVALTFDMAADNVNVATLLDSLQTKQIPATFFVSGSFATKHPELTKRLATDFEVGNHGFSTSSFAALTAAQVKQQIVDTETAFQNAFGESDGHAPMIFRSPYGDTAATIVQGAKQAGYCTVLWTVDAFDWKNDQTATGAATRAIEKLKPGAVLLFHAGYDITAEAVEQLIAAATNQGFSFATVSRMLSTGGD